MTAPKEFSIMNNPDDTLKYFDEIFDNINNAKYRQILFFDLSRVETITVDAIMYLIAIIKNVYKIRTLQLECKGNMPLNVEAQQIVVNSGFFDYVQPQFKLNRTVSEQISISTGDNVDSILVGKVCDFIHKLCNLKIIHTKFLFPMLIELMTNTSQHAYNNNNTMRNKWYIYVENHQAYVQFVFLDTGAGIPKTIRTDFFEKVKSYIGNSDAYFIASALKGDFRTETEDEHRGKGLPEIYERVKKNRISEFSIVSGKGGCIINENGDIIETKFPFRLRGALFSWKFIK